ncbi:hypothetical protein N0V82_009571 [Gnomoniopsis sp. IMI 355080]|nr:hypothetical protein N0V82_009571 [Gnomoniopsis sp. IMI 355080]
MATLSGDALPPPKQIRFVNNQGQPPSKRRRVNAACLTCRRRKTRCDGEKPTCSTCEKNGHQCLGYPDHSPEKPKHESLNIHVKVESDRSIHRSSFAEPTDEEIDDGLDHDEGRHSKLQKERPKREPVSSGFDRRDSRSTTIGPAVAQARKESNDWDVESPTSQPTSGRPISTDGKVSISEDGRSPSEPSPVQHHPHSHKVPYFRYFGPTAIVPGLKQMVVNAPVQTYNRRRTSRGSTSATSPLSLISLRSGPSHAETVLEPMDDLPAYDPNDKAPVPQLIIKLVETFFQHLKYIHPFLREKKTLRLVKEKKVESILVDAMCALAARFANFDGLPATVGSSRSEYGNVFAQRAKAATVDTFPCPTVGAVQAYLLMAYEGFGANQDSALWMYLGLAIRMAFDMGLQKNEGVQYQGAKDPWYTGSWNRPTTDDEDESSPAMEDEQLDQQEQQEIVQERIDTAWAVYILDRVISTGTGRTVTLRDDEFELPIPQPHIDPSTGLEAPYPMFAHIIQLYGRVSDVINKLKKPTDLTDDKLATLAKIERELLGLHSSAVPRLDFNPLLFQKYVKSGQGTMFILSRVWFHSCVIILHQPLLTPFGNQRRQLTRGSHDIALGSARSIADILAVAELIDPNSYLSSPFTSQPMYIAACAWLVASTSNVSEPVSRAPSPGLDKQNVSSYSNSHNGKTTHTNERPEKHAWLVAEATKHYQRCYKSLQQLHEYWGGVKYILNALDHRSKGVWDCETYTAEEYASTKLLRRPAALAKFHRADNASSPQPPSVPPLAWSLTGTTNSPNLGIGLLYQNTPAKDTLTKSTQTAQLPPPPASQAPVSAPTPPGNWRFDPVRPDIPAPYSPAYPQANVSAVRYSVDSSDSTRISQSIQNTTTEGGRNSMQFDSLLSASNGPGTPGNENRLQVLSNIASGNNILPSLPYTPNSNYETSILPAASPSGTLPDQGGSQQRTHQVNSVPGPNAADMIGSYGHDFSRNGAASGWNSGSLPSSIMVEQIAGSLEMQGDDMFGPWDFFHSGSISDLFDPAHWGDTGHQGQL